MGRKAQPFRSPDQDVTPEDTPGLPAAMENFALSIDIEKDDIFNAGVDIGRIEALDFVATVANSAILSVFESVKKSKAWKHLRNPENSNGSNFSSIDEFCRVKLGKTYGRMQHLVSNRNLLGQEAFEQAEKLGLRQSDYDLIKTLPAPKQAIIKEALSDGATKEELQKAIRELAAADQREIEALNQQIEAKRKAEEELNETLAAKDRVVGQKEKTISSLEEKLVKLQNRDPDAVEAERLSHEADLRVEMQHAADALWPAVARFAQTAANCLQDAEPQSAMYEYVISAVQYAFQRIDEVAKKHQIPVDFAEVVTPAWMQSVTPSEAVEA